MSNMENIYIGSSEQSVEDEPEDLFVPEFFVDKDYTAEDVIIGDLSLTMYALHNAASTDHDLTGQIIWPACKVLSIYLWKHPELVQNSSVLEVGSGAGLGGLIAASLSSAPSRIVLSDYQETVLDVLQRNIKANFPDQGSPRCASLYWGQGLEKFEKTFGTFDLIIGADVVFWPDAVAPLWKTVDHLLKKRPGAKFLCSYIPRAGFTSKLLLDEASKAKFTWEYVDLTQNELYTDLLHNQTLCGRTAEIIKFSRS